MSETTSIPLDRLEAYMEAFTKRFLNNGWPRAVDVELVALDLGDQLPIQGARLLGVTYDPDTEELDLALDSGDHRVLAPREVWAIEEMDGFLSVIAIVRSDGSQELVSVKRVGVQARS